MSTTAITIGFVCLTLGVLIGMLIARLTGPDEKKRRNVERRLRETEQQLKNYQHDTTDHFIKTSALINNLTQSYRDVHEHFVSSAMHLTTPETTRQLLKAGPNSLADQLSLDNHTLSGNAPEPPRDYAPKSPEGILSESYGFANEASHTPTPHYAPIDSHYVDDDDDPTLKTV